MHVPGASQDASHVIKRALAHLILKFPFCGYSLAGESVRIEERSIDSPACTNGYHIYYSPDITKYEKDAAFTLCHEFLHVLEFHVPRRGNRKAERWNAACDIWANAECQQLLNERIPEWMAYTHQDLNRSSREVLNMTAEQIYEEIPENLQPRMKDLQPGMEEPGKQEKELWKHKFRRDIHRAHTAVNLTGAPVPPGSNTESRIYRIIRNRVPWERLIPQDVISRMEADEVSYAPPLLRYYPDLILPRVTGHTGPEVMVAVDISASVPKHALDMFASSLHPIGVRASRVHVLTFDQVIRETYVSDQPEALLRNIGFRQGGHGFTSTVPVFQYWDQHPEIVTAIVLTDCFVQFPEKPYRNTIWVKTTTIEPPWGKSYYMDIGDHV